jgi:hypothetical protein
METEQVAEWWCSRCGQPVQLLGGDDVPVSLRKAVHAVTGSETGAAGHLAVPVGYEPPLWQAARELMEETGGAFDVSAEHGFLRADWVRVPAGMVAMNYTADDKAAMSLKLRRALIAAGVGQGTPIMRGEAAGQ